MTMTSILTNSDIAMNLYKILSSIRIDKEMIQVRMTVRMLMALMATGEEAVSSTIINDDRSDQNGKPTSFDLFNCVAREVKVVGP